jgi:hypothetical protein
MRYINMSLKQIQLTIPEDKFIDINDFPRRKLFDAKNR